MHHRARQSDHEPLIGYSKVTDSLSLCSRRLICSVRFLTLFSCDPGGLDDLGVACRYAALKRKSRGRATRYGGGHDQLARLPSRQLRLDAV